MAYYFDDIKIGRRMVRLAYGTSGGGTAGRTQTINICTWRNRPGEYEEVYRIKDPGRFIHMSDLAGISAIDALVKLALERGAISEGPRIRAGK